MVHLGFPISLLFTVKGELGPLKDVDKQVEAFAMRMRLTGRDMMRLGGAIDRFFSRVQSGIYGVLKGSLDWEAAQEDIRWAWEDIGAVLGDVLAPALEWLANLLEWIAEILEANPWLAYLVGVILVAAWIGKLIGQVMSLVGALNIWFGVLLRVHAAHVGLGASIHAFFTYLRGGQAALEAYLMNLQKTQKVTTNYVQTALDQFLSSQIQQIKGTRKAVKATRGLGRATKGLTPAMRGIGIGVGIFGLFLGIILAAEPIMELFGSFIEAISPALEVLAGIFEPIIDYIAEWIEQNPELAAGILAALAAILGILAFSGTFEGFLGKIWDFMKGAPGMMPGLSKNIKNLAYAIFFLAAAIGVLVISFGAAIWLIGQTKFTIPEVIALIWNLTAAITMLLGVLIIFRIALKLAHVTLAPLCPVLMTLAAFLLAIGATVFLIGAGFMLMGLGVQFAAQGLLSLVGYIPQLIVMVPLLFGLAAGFGALALAATLAIVPLMGLSVAFFALSASILALAGTLAFLQAIGLGGVAESIAHGITVALIPKMQAGGIVERGGMAILHPGEEVVPARVTRRKERAEVPTSVSINFYGPVTSRDFVERDVIPLVKEAVERELRRV